MLWFKLKQDPRDKIIADAQGRIDRQALGISKLEKENDSLQNLLLSAEAQNRPYKDGYETICRAIEELGHKLKMYEQWESEQMQLAELSDETIEKQRVLIDTLEKQLAAERKMW